MIIVFNVKLTYVIDMKKYRNLFENLVDFDYTHICLLIIGHNHYYM